MEKWKKAVVHLECATDSVDYLEIENDENYRKILEQLEEARRTQQISIGEFHVLKSQITNQFYKSRDKRFHGTGVFLTHKENYYLITARHVLFDEILAKREYNREYKRIEDEHNFLVNSGKFSEIDIETSERHRVQRLAELASKNFDSTIFPIIFRVPSLDEINTYGADADRQFLMNLGAGGNFTGAYIFSEPDIDIAIISLNGLQLRRRFADNLLASGYLPVTIDDIGEQPSAEGAEVFTVGFPASTAVLGLFSDNTDLGYWRSNYFSIPNFVFGRISMLHSALNYFWTDMSIYPGNSGGPVIENNKLVSIVSAQAQIPLDKTDEKTPDYFVRIPFGRIIKAENVLVLLETLRRSEAGFAAVMKGI